jgi:hypothetical protein
MSSTRVGTAGTGYLSCTGRSAARIALTLLLEGYSGKEIARATGTLDSTPTDPRRRRGGIRRGFGEQHTVRLKIVHDKERKPFF